MAADLSRQLGYLSEADTARVRSLFERAGLPTAVRGISPARMQQLMRLDKKARDGRVHFVLLERLGWPCFAPTYRLVQSITRSRGLPPE